MITPVNTRQASLNSKNSKMISFCIFLFVICCLLSTACRCFAEEQTVITSENLEYNKETSTYTAKGNVKLQRADTVIEADEMLYNEQTSETLAAGNVKYLEKEVSMKANRAELNLESKTGTVYDAEIIFKKDNYHISGKIIEKKGEEYYYSPDATFTTCDAPVPAWCFKGKDVDAITKDRLKAKDVSFRIKNVPVLYTPYFQAPILNERKTGLLTPVLGYSNLRGLHVNVPFYWAISENRDATFILDEYTKRGIGEGLEYRYIEPKNIKGELRLYHIRDRELDKDFFEFRALHEQRSTEKIGGFLNINLVNEKDFYREYSPYGNLKFSRFLESTGEITIPFSNSRTYLLSQYWMDLKEESKSVLEKLPEAGYVLNPTKIGHLWISGTTTISNFWRNEGMYGQRFDIYPKILHSFGNDIVFSQSFGLRETVYALHRSDDNSLHRESFEYTIENHTRFSKKYGSFTHIAEPSLSYTLISNSENSLPLFDSAELFKKTSLIEFSLLNRLIDNKGELMAIRASQGFDSYLGDRPFLPLKLQVGIKRPVTMRFDADYDLHTGKLENSNSDLFVKIFETTFSAGHRYNRQNNITFYSAGIGLHPYKPLYLGGRIWYDAEEKEAKDIVMNIKYISQCWGISMEFIKRPGDFNVVILFELKGLTRPLKM